MADDVSITLVYEDGGGDDGTITSPTNEGFPSDNPLAAGGSAKKLAGLATAKQLGSTALNYATSHVGTFSGSSHKQDIANGVMSAVGTVTSIAANPILGTVNWLVGKVTELSDYMYNRKWEGHSLNQARIRAGSNYTHSRTAAW